MDDKEAQFEKWWMEFTNGNWGDHQKRISWIAWQAGYKLGLNDGIDSGIDSGYDSGYYDGFDSGVSFVKEIE